ncbi:hypothetical protein C8Q76DRAFT_802814 [Earliella scabrosa]|nr:hypothetical protein C8Q76DRAFT_802814 [Earliella scabrosa]
MDPSPPPDSEPSSPRFRYRIIDRGQGELASPVQPPEEGTPIVNCHHVGGCIGPRDDPPRSALLPSTVADQPVQPLPASQRLQNSSPTSSARTGGTMTSSSVADQLLQGPSSTARPSGTSSASGLTPTMASDRHDQGQYPISPFSQTRSYPWFGSSSSSAFSNSGNRTLSVGYSDSIASASRLLQISNIRSSADGDDELDSSPSSQGPQPTYLGPAFNSGNVFYTPHGYSTPSQFWQTSNASFGYAPSASNSDDPHSHSSGASDQQPLTHHEAYGFSSGQGGRGSVGYGYASHSSSYEGARPLSDVSETAPHLATQRSHSSGYWGAPESTETSSRISSRPTTASDSWGTIVPPEPSPADPHRPPTPSGSRRTLEVADGAIRVSDRPSTPGDSWRAVESAESAPRASRRPRRQRTSARTPETSETLRGSGRPPRRGRSKKISAEPPSQITYQFVPSNYPPTTDQSSRPTSRSSRRPLTPSGSSRTVEMSEAASRRPRRNATPSGSSRTTQMAEASSRRPRRNATPSGSSRTTEMAGADSTERTSTMDEDASSRQDSSSTPPKCTNPQCSAPAARIHGSGPSAFNIWCERCDEHSRMRMFHTINHYAAYLKAYEDYLRRQRK